jgi:hypothetical protein
MHLFSFVPAPGLAHLPTQFAALFSHRGASVTAFAGELRITAMPIRVIAKKRCRAIFEPPEKGERGHFTSPFEVKRITLQRAGHFRSCPMSGHLNVQPHLVKLIWIRRLRALVLIESEPKLWILLLTRFLNANRYPPRSKTL